MQKDERYRSGEEMLLVMILWTILDLHIQHKYERLFFPSAHHLNKCHVAFSRLIA